MSTASVATSYRARSGSGARSLLAGLDAALLAVAAATYATTGSGDTEARTSPVR